MPIYEYACPDCEHQFENIQKFSDPLLTDCPECGADKLKKLVSATSFHLKGSGWYKDHYGLKSSTDVSESSSGGGGSSSTSGSSSGSSETAGSADNASASTTKKTNSSTDSSGGAST
ncbi:MAG: zinc ribbon domain-containing protein [Myxococcota bacterium]|nr:zinc ribbon domain-containing protein [Myxococcota bacterium]